MAKDSPRADWSYPTAVRFGEGRITELAEACAEAGMSRPLLVTDRRILEIPAAAKALDSFKAAGMPLAIFDDAKPDPAGEDLDAAIDAFRASDCDGVAALGGGSCMDLGKLVAFMAGQSRSVWDFEDGGDRWRRADAVSIFPSVAAPTTAGTGSEVGRAGILTDSRNRVKKIIFHPRMLPVSAICDPALTCGAPPHITAGAGMDAFIHCLEAFCAPAYHPMSAGIALEGMRLAKENLPRAFAHGGDIEARAHMMSAAAMGAAAFQKGLGAAHALAHPLGAMYGTHHGMTCATVLPAVLQFNRESAGEQIAACADYLRIRGGFDGFFKYVTDLMRTLGVPESLEELGAAVEDGDLPRLSEMAAADPSAAGNPRPLSAEDARRLLIECRHRR